MKYHISLRLVHWVMAVLILGLIGLGYYMNTLSPQEGKYDLYDLHKSLGMIVIGLFAVRLILRFITKVPQLPQGIKPVEKKMSKATHILLYVGMIIVPVIGYVYSMTGGYGVEIFGLEVPALIDKNKQIHEIAGELHVIVAYMVLALVALHLIGALKHRFFEKPENDVLNRMI